MNHPSGHLRAPLSIHIEGAATEAHRLPLQDLVLFADHFQTAVERVARLLTGRLTSAQRGPLPANISRWCALDLISVGPGSITIICDLPETPQQMLFDDLGVEAVSTLVSGIAAIDQDGSAIPANFDKGVLLALREAGKVLSRGVDRITFDFGANNRRWSSSYTRKTHTHVVEHIQGPIETRRTVEGRLLAGDFKESGRRCRVHPAGSRPVDCTFEEDQQRAVLDALTKRVRIVGEALESDGSIRLLKLSDIEIIDDEDVIESTQSGGAFFDASPSLAALAAEQGVVPAFDFDRLVGDFWPDDETADDLISAVREWRHEGT